MAGIRKRCWITKNGTKKTCYEITYYIHGELKSKSGFKTKQEAQYAIPKVTNLFDTNILLSELANDYLQRHCELHCKESSRDVYRTYINVNLKSLLNRKAKDITKRDIEELMFTFKRQKFTNKTINSILTFIQALYNYGIDNEFLSGNPVKKIKRLPPDKKKVQFLSEDEIKLFLEKAKNLTPDYYAVFYTALFTGMRRGELLALEWSDINFKNKTISVNKQIYKGKLSDTKTYTSTRTVDISDCLVKVLKEHMELSNKNNKIVFCNKNGTYLHPYNMSEKYYKKVLKALSEAVPYENKLDKLRFHDLRHTYATYLLSRNVPVKYVQEQLGHANSRITLDTYGHVMPSVKSKAIEILNEL